MQPEIDRRREETDKQENASTVYEPIVDICLLDWWIGAELIFHRLIQRNKVIKPQRW